MRRILVTGSNGLIGSGVVDHFHSLGWRVHGIDNNMRADFFGPAGDTRWNQARLLRTLPRFQHHELDIRDRDRVVRVVSEVTPDAVVHAAAQPSHDLAASRPFDDFDINAVGTLNLLEAVRRACPDAPFVFMSTNKVYGDRPNRILLTEKRERWHYADPEFANGIPESFPIDHSKHSLFGASKLAADVLVQEYGRYFDMPTCCLRCGCLTGAAHAGVPLHGFLSYLVRVNVTGGVYRVLGYKGKQVRDNIHSVDVARFIHAFIEQPRIAEVYNLGGGPQNSCSILEAFSRAEAFSGRAMRWEYQDEARIGDHICYMSDLTKCREHYREWDLTRSLDDIFAELVLASRERSRLHA